MPYYCTVPRCTSMAGKAKNVSFHQFPRDEELATLWNDILKRGKPYTKYSKVCSLHFNPEDYTITSVGKNKGQWRTLRKDAVPSRNLPTDPVPQRRRSNGSWIPNDPPNILDPRMQQQMAQAIYMQTMLAMQNIAATESNEISSSIGQPSNESPQSIETAQDTKTSYKCAECTKCFKDPDVFTLHKRTHNKNKENLNTNAEDTLKSNPILANLLRSQESSSKYQNESHSEMQNNGFSIENHIMAAIALNMENYMRNLLLSQNTNVSNHMNDDSSRDGSDCDKNLDDSSESNRLVIDENA